MSTSLFITTPKGLEPLLAEELQQLGLTAVKPTRAGVKCQGSLAQAYRICLWSRLANRVLLPLAHFPAASPEALYQGIQTIQWDEHLAAEGTLAVDFVSLHSQLQHTHFGAQTVKDAIVDQFRARYQKRPSVALQQPQVRIHVFLERDQATVSIDLAGESLHKRGYRTVGGIAPLKENVAAAILLYARWPQIAAQGGTLLDPMCGSGTLLIEATCIAARIAPGLQRHYFGFLGWHQHVPAIWTTLLAEAKSAIIDGPIPAIIGYDADKQAVRSALAHVEQIGLKDKIHVERRALAQLTTLPHPPGLIVVNPPYGERLGERAAVAQLYQCLGDHLKTYFQGWQATVLTGDAELGKQMGIRAHKYHTVYNGALACKLLHFDVTPTRFMHQHRKDNTPPASTTLQDPTQTHMLANRLLKNLRRLQPWADKAHIRCFRVYDADIPEYAFAVDVYENWLHVQEYAAPPQIEAHKVQARAQEAVQIIAATLPHVQLFLKTRRRGKTPYEKLANTAHFYEVHEGKAIFLVNFTDYLDTGLFLEQRATRQLIQQWASGRRFLNLFGYTGTATVCAALGGATQTTTVDLSHNYLTWARRNLARNGFSEHHHRFVQSDCLTWLQQTTQHYELILLDPPTFSNSKCLKNDLDVQRDHQVLIQAALNHLTRDGILLFSTHHRRFKMDISALTAIQVEDISAATLPEDFKRNPRIRQCWKITKH